MRKMNDLPKNVIKDMLNQLYSYFSDGYQFEDFLKVYLDKMGLEEVFTTQKSRDGGYDLTAKRKGIGGLSEGDAISYYVQAKKFPPSASISVRSIRELKGIIPYGHKGIFITTAKFSSDSKTEALNDPTRPIILIDGIELLLSCIDLEIGFTFTPVFSKTAMNMLLGKQASAEQINFIEKPITANDIRARILRIPSHIYSQIPPDENQLTVRFVDGDVLTLTINRSGKFLSGITSEYKRLGIIMDDGTFCPKIAKWNYDADNRTSIIMLGDQ